MTTVTKSKPKSKKEISLQSHQKKVVNHITNPKNRSILVYHSLGSGKTISSLTSVAELHKMYPDKTITILSPASLISNFEKEAKRLKLTFPMEIESYHKFLNKMKKGEEPKCDQCILVADEVQNLNSSDSVLYKAIRRYSRKAFKVILLSATPVKNRPNEFSNQLSLLTNEKITQGQLDKINGIESESAKNRAYSKLLKCKISYYQKNTESDDYPVIKDFTEPFTMSRAYYLKYYDIQENLLDKLPKDVFTNAKDLATYLNGVRRAVNKIDNESPKIDWTVKKIKESIEKGEKIMVYSNWLDSGLNIIKEHLIKEKIKFSEITGKLSKKEKDANLIAYNSGKHKVILLSSSGSEGISLKETRHTVLLEPHWNSAKIDQVIGRAVRFKSHSSLPKDQRNVKVYTLILKKPLLRFRDSIGSADELLLEMSERKEKAINEFYKILKRNAIEYNNCDKVKSRSRS